MNKKHIENILKQAKRCFLENDHYLFTVEANERSLTHKFAEYLQNIFGYEWSVDCEYNRFGQDGKKIVEIIEQMVGKDTITSETKTRTVYPDIIVHKRGLEGPNLIVIEAKKDATVKEKSGDVKKLKIIKEKYNYKFAIFVNFKIKTKKIIWFFCYDKRC
ncbi:MAG: hypothetical protein A3F95_00020 [Candidatus Nealsonbacteria bacterium RIFCSPLOWO2_12_FULL_39_31]|uniref:Type I restriction enzyme R protein N-terminal domain-containing protein n=1 Tax=Candidatus Nealsonbacteria bacterium RIFCSPLOWO2_12_FULL_39_31 TaxID=1801676 RepID=A0A1G2ENC6_9BACT|nr:MAG: hypothetical protein A3F95_00020 [Candidatus Nealsonbacteria bacterium RIFCSPLOWO2_12_FULL_39_31]